MIDLKKRKSAWPATSAKGSQFKSAETGQFGRCVSWLIFGMNLDRVIIGFGLGFHLFE